MKVIGIVLIVIGLIGLIYGGVTWTKKDTVLDFGSVEVTHDETKGLPIPPIAGGLCLIAGTVILVTGPRMRRRE